MGERLGSCLTHNSASLPSCIYLLVLKKATSRIYYLDVPDKSSLLRTCFRVHGPIAARFRDGRGLHDVIFFEVNESSLTNKLHFTKAAVLQLTYNFIFSLFISN